MASDGIVQLGCGEVQHLSEQFVRMGKEVGHKL